MRWGKIALLLGLMLCIAGAEAHSWRTDKNGCHIDHKTGTRHCH